MKNNRLEICLGAIASAKVAGLGLGFLLCAGLAVTRVGAATQTQDQLPPTVATFSILGYDPETDEVGELSSRACLRSPAC